MKNISLVLVEDGIQILKLDFPTEASAEMIWETVQPLRSSRGRGEVRVSGKYGRLTKYFSDIKECRIQMSFADVRRAHGSDLPASAAIYRAWWANDPNHSQAKAWLSSGWRSKEVDMATQQVIFERDG
ncbi:hypothetical protein E7T09_11185 [Deinococcus sp. KSM4-11]|uniref:DUF7662 domain-containing protein n=1 Tax=Deinococcus sp. KSM4-11 TaxID=2568654 RepID=UPI0010A34484|nr:hypothetical protein [Deinococcus sp. KSM4-11]THF86650.1 hypothetical protein E7T09_11185 [Deinococcus sp. KSM4-11]